MGLPQKPEERAKVDSSFEVLHGAETARLWIIVELDGETMRYCFISGPYRDVKAYYDGEITLDEYKARVNKR
jgi:hypothetical protein